MMRLTADAEVAAASGSISVLFMIVLSAGGYMAGCVSAGSQFVSQ